MFGQEIHLLESLSYGEAPRAIAHDHRVIRVFHHSLGEARNVFNAAHSGDGPGTVRWPVHHAGVELDFAFLIGESAIADGIVVGIVLDHSDHSHDGVERVPAFLQDVHALVERMQAVGARDKERALTCRGGLARRGRSGVFEGETTISVRGCATEDFIGSGEGATSQGSKKEFTS